MIEWNKSEFTNIDFEIIAKEKFSNINKCYFMQEILVLD